MEKNSRGSMALLTILVVATLATTFFVASEYNLLGAIIGVANTISSCNIAVYNSIANIAHDFVCDNENGFVVKRDNIGD